MKNIEGNNDNNKASGALKIIIAVFITAVVTYFITTTCVFKKYLNSSNASYLSTKLGIIKQRLDKAYIYDMDENKMIENAIKGYVSGVGDEYTEYLTTDEMKALIENTAGKYVGIGVYLAENKADDTIVIIGVIEGSPAEEAGIKAGDILKSVNGIDYTGKKLTEASNLLKDKNDGNQVKVVIVRDSEEIELSVERRNVRIKAVTSELKEGNIGYIKVSTFNEGTADEFKNVYEELNKQGASKLIIDLRNNGGGLVSESLKIADLMVPKGNTMLITSNKENKEKQEKASKDPIITVPVVILINENSASASEILAGCLKDNCNYKIVGTKSYGKGVIQTILSLPDSSGIKITTDEYFTPNHNTINKVGIKPDIEVVVEDEASSLYSKDNDIQLKRAIEEIKAN